jgi:hypothetical protein
MQPVCQSQKGENLCFSETLCRARPNILSHCRVNKSAELAELTLNNARAEVIEGSIAE